MSFDWFNEHVQQQPYQQAQEPFRRNGQAASPPQGRLHITFLNHNVAGKIISITSTTNSTQVYYIQAKCHLGYGYPEVKLELPSGNYQCQIMGGEEVKYITVSPATSDNPRDKEAYATFLTWPKSSPPSHVSRGVAR